MFFVVVEQILHRVHYFLIFAVSFFFSLPPPLSAIDNVFVPVILMTRTTATTDVNDRRQSGSSSDRRSGQLGRRHDVTLGGPSVLIHWLLLSVNGFHCLCLYFVCSCSFVHSFDPFLSTSSNRLAAAALLLLCLPVPIS